MIFIEGLPCAGKSLLIKEMEACGDKVTYEIGNVLHRSRFPGNASSFEEAMSINRWFIGKEQERMHKSDSLFFDRSYLTHFCYAYAYEKYKNITIFEKTIEMYRNEVEQGLLDVPKGIIYLNISSEDSIKRQREKIEKKISKGLPDFWRNQQFLEDTRDAYKALFSSVVDIPWIEIDATLSTYDKYNIINKWSNKIENTKYGCFSFDDFINTCLKV